MSLDSEPLLGQLLDAIPGFALLVDQDVSILRYNSAARDLLAAEQRGILRQRGGDALHCVHSTNVGDGCGRTEFCKTCLIRGAVSQALAGTKCVRRRFRMELKSGGKISELYVLLSASALVYQGRKVVLLILEDVAELMELQNLLPICINCKRVRDARMSWNAVDAYLKRHMDLLLTNSYCPECLAQQTELAELQQRVATLTPREYEVFCLVTKGRLNKQIAAVLGTAEKTIKIHRGRVMAKMQVQSAAELVHLASRLGLLSKRRPDEERHIHAAETADGRHIHPRSP